MLRTRILLLTAVITAGQWVAYSAQADAGPLLNWLRGCRRPARAPAAASCCPTPATSAVAANANGLQPGQCLTTCQQTCSRVVVNYVPCTSYRTSWDRIPVTQYKPETKSDPCSGCTVTCMKPCTTYTYRMRRVPYTTYRPVYRTETYKVPVSYISNDCNSCGSCNTCPTSAPVAAGCQSCSVPSAGTPILVNPTPTMVVPNGTISIDGGYGIQPSSVLPSVGNSPAEISPSLNPQNMQRPIYEKIESTPVEGSSTRIQLPAPSGTGSENWTTTRTSVSNPEWNDQAPAQIEINDKLASSPIRRKWDYSPVRLAAYTSVEKPSQQANVVEFQGHFAPIASTAKPQSKPACKVNAGWDTVEW